MGQLKERKLAVMKVELKVEMMDKLSVDLKENMMVGLTELKMAVLLVAKWV